MNIFITGTYVATDVFSGFNRYIMFVFWTIDITDTSIS